ncbi:MAG: type II secretion system protein [Lachnospiraceae bacterium]|nr:type II secretion system protein [Lachnospiraceae bacterium]
MKNNKGMTMIEVVVVIALIAIITSGTVLSVSSLRRARVKKQYDLLQSQVINLREKTLTSSDLTTGAIYYDSTADEYYFAIFELDRSKMLNLSTATITNDDIKATIEEKVLLSSNMEYYYSFDGGTNKVQITESSPLIIHFDRSDGRLMNNKTNTKAGQLTLYVSNSSSEKSFSVSCTTGRIVDYN